MNINRSFDPRAWSGTWRNQFWFNTPAEMDYWMLEARENPGRIPVYRRAANMHARHVHNTVRRLVKRWKRAVVFKKFRRAQRSPSHRFYRR